MSIVAKYGKDAVGDQPVKCRGFSISRAGNHIIAWFTILANKEDATFLFKTPVKMSEIEPLYAALALPLPLEETGFVFPSVEDIDKLGFDKPIIAKVTKEGGYLNVSDFKADTGSGAAVANNESLPF